MKATDLFRSKVFKRTDDPVELDSEQLAEVSVYYPDFLALTQIGHAPANRFLEYDGSMIERISVDWNENLVTFFFIGKRHPESIEANEEFTLMVVKVIREENSLDSFPGTYRGVDHEA